MELLEQATITFSKGKINPVSFRWYGRDYEVSNINLIFNRRDGTRKYLCFAIDTSGMSVELRLDTGDLHWWIEHEQ